MKKTAAIVLGALALIALTATSSFAQGWGRGMGRMGGMRGGCFARGVGGGWGAGAGLQALATTDAEKKLVKEVTDLHQQVRTKQLELFALERQKADEKQIAAAQKELDQLRERLCKVNQDGRKLRWEMVDRARKQVAQGGVAMGGPGIGACPMGLGLGPRGMGLGLGRGFGPGGGMGLNCPWVTPPAADTGAAK
jgi:hypothetical protein